MIDIEILKQTSLYGSFKCSFDYQKFQKNYKQHIKKEYKSLNIKGFRAGKVSINILERKLGKKHKSEFLQNNLSTEIGSFIEKNKLNIYDTPKIKEKEYEENIQKVIDGKGEDFQFTLLSFLLLSKEELLESIHTTEKVENYQIELKEKEKQEIIEKLQLVHRSMKQKIEKEEKDKIVEKGDTIQVSIKLENDISFEMIFSIKNKIKDNDALAVFLDKKMLTDFEITFTEDLCDKGLNTFPHIHEYSPYFKEILQPFWNQKAQCNIKYIVKYDEENKELEKLNTHHLSWFFNIFGKDIKSYSHTTLSKITASVIETDNKIGCFLLTLEQLLLKPYEKYGDDMPNETEAEVLLDGSNIKNIFSAKDKKKEEELHEKIKKLYLKDKRKKTLFILLISSIIKSLSKEEVDRFIEVENQLYLETYPITILLKENIIKEDEKKELGKKNIELMKYLISQQDSSSSYNTLYWKVLIKLIKGYIEKHINKDLLEKESVIDAVTLSKKLSTSSLEIVKNSLNLSLI